MTESVNAINVRLNEQSAANVNFLHRSLRYEEF